MVLGLSRAKARSAAPLVPLAPQFDWQTARGPMVYETVADLTGAFPGYIGHGARLDHVQVRVSDSHLLVDEGRAHGFMLPFEQIVATDDGDPGMHDDQIVRVRYRDAEETRLFTIRPRASRLTLRGGRRPIRLLDELHALGVPGGPLDDIPTDSFVTTWGETDAFGNEAMVWHGRASASLLLSGDRFSCDVFITSKSLVWGKDARSPISRVPLSAIRDVTPGLGGTRALYPAAFIGIGDSGYDRVEFSFVFDAYDTEDRNALERSAFVVHLRSRPVALAYPQAPHQPWIVPVMADPIPEPIWPSSVNAVRVPQRLGQRLRERATPIETSEQQPAFKDPVERLRPDRGVVTAYDWETPADVVSSWPEPVLPIADVTPEVIAEPIAAVERDDVVLSEWSVPETMPGLAEAAAPRAITPIPLNTPALIEPDSPVSAMQNPVEQFEVEALATLTDILDVIRRREAGDMTAMTTHRPPSGAALAAALDDIVERMARGDLAPELATRKKAHLLGLDDATHRLDVLLPLHANGAVTTAELRARCDALCTELGNALFAGRR